MIGSKQPSPSALSRLRSSSAILVVVAAFLLSRVLYLDQDVPILTFTFYNPTDEPYYTGPAFSLFNYGTWTHKVFDFLPPDETPFNTFANLLTYFGLLAFGNNFFGLRMPVAVCGLVVFIGCLWCINRIPTSQRAWRKLIVVLAAAYMFADFFFLQSNRVNDPTTFMMATIAACMVLVIAVELWIPRSVLGSMLLGLAAGIITTFVYVYMVYVAAALGMTVLFCRWRDEPRRLLPHLSVFALGVVLAILLFAGFVRFFFHVNPVESFQQMLVMGGSRASFMTSNIFDFVSRNFADAVGQTFGHNLFFYHPALLLVYVSALPIFAINLVSKRRSIDVFVAACLVFRFLLSVMIPFDYYEKKLIQVFPLVIYVIAAAAISASAVYRDVFGKRRIWLALYAVLVVVLAFAVFRFGQVRVPAEHVQPRLVARTELWIALAFLLLLLLRSSVAKGIGALMLAMTLVLPNIRLDREFVYGEPTFMYRDSLIRAAPILNGKILAGGVPQIMRLYNTSIPVMNFYRYYYYGRDKFSEFSKFLFENKLVDGTILLVPSPPSEPLLKSTHEYINSGDLVLEETWDINDVERKYKFSLYLLRGGRNAKAIDCGGDCSATSSEK
jgi:hypothetical protein